MTGQSILIVDDEEIIRDALGKDLLDFGYNICTAKNGEEACVYLEKGRHDLAIIDLVMPGFNGIETARRFLKLQPDLKIIILTGYGTLDSAIEALRLGVCDYLFKPCDRKLLKETIKKNLEGEPGSRKKGGIQNLFDNLNNYPLTEREREICEMLLMGQTRSDIAVKLFISKNTVDTHVKNIYKKMGVSNFQKVLEKLLN